QYVYETGCTDTDGALLDAVHRHFGFGADKTILEALECWSQAIRALPPSGEEQTGAFRVGPSFPFSVEGRYMPQMDPSSKGYFMTSEYRPFNGNHQASTALSGVRLPMEKARLDEMEPGRRLHEVRA
ncbi:MAG: hypothetical protein K6F49_10290, partial [Saccharofermentans sp.]|nr:hypothetical protein [Saccharofermentans sp.]